MRNLIHCMGIAAAAAFVATASYAVEPFDPNTAAAKEDAQHDMGTESHLDSSLESAKQMPAASTSSGEQYVVEEGDTLSAIAEEKLGSADEWKALARANDIAEPEKLRVGQTLEIPTDRQS